MSISVLLDLIDAGNYNEAWGEIGDLEYPDILEGEFWKIHISWYKFHSMESIEIAEKAIKFADENDQQIWKLMFELATKLNIQVFATTHSWDCIEAFSMAANQSNEEAILFRIGQSVLPKDNGKTIATVFDKNSLHNLTQSDVELR